MPEFKRVLVIDDDKTVQLLLKAALEKAGFRVTAALDAAQGMMYARQQHPDLIVLDIMMPAGGGFAVYERLQMMSASFECPFIIYSSMPRAEIEARIHEGPLTAILSKTASLDTLVAAAARLTGS